MAKNQMINCPTCGQPMAANAKACPSCGAKNKQPFYKKWWFWVIVVVLILGVAEGTGGASSGKATASGSAGSAPANTAADTAANSESTAPSAADTAPSEPEPTPAPDLALQGEVTETKDAVAAYYEGIVINNKDRDLSYAQVTFTLYDADGNQIGTALDNINNLKAGGTWKFKALALCDKDEIASWELTEITGY